MTRALVLGGGGPVGIAWESGLVAGLARGGVNLGQADFIMGTSAGSFVGARLAMGEDPAALVDPILAEQPKGPPVNSPSSLSATPPDLTRLTRLMMDAVEGRRDPALVMQEIGAFALQARTPDEETFIRSFGRSFSSLPEDAWPERNFACTAVDAETGEFRLWTRDSGVGVTRAVASSCSVPGVYPPVTLKGARYMDGGMRSSTNCDLAVGHNLVVVIQVRTGSAAGAAAEAYEAHFKTETESLQQGGAEVIILSPDEASLAAMGTNLMDFRNRRAAAQAGLAQGLACAEGLHPRWV